MRLFNPFRRRQSAPIARERLQILLSHERSTQGHSELLGILREEILAALGKHISIDQDNVVIRMDRGAKLSTLEIELAIPHSAAIGGLAA